MTIDEFAVSSQPFGVLVEWQGRLVVVSVTGELDLATAPELTESLDAVLARDPESVVVDLSDVAFLASSGMSALASAHHRIGDSATFAVVADGPATGRPLELVGLTQTLKIFASLDEALVELRGSTN